MKRALAICLAALACWASLAQGQVAQQPAGQALDANYQIGSGGYNTVNGGQGGVNSQLIVTGQVTGLNNFHGRVNYYAPDQLNMTVPSAGMDRFRQQAVGVTDVLSNRVSQSSPYYAPSTSVYNAQGIASGQGRLGVTTFVPLTPAQQAYNNAMLLNQPLTVAPVKSVERSTNSGYQPQVFFGDYPGQQASGAAFTLGPAPSDLRSDETRAKWRELDAQLDARAHPLRQIDAGDSDGERPGGLARLPRPAVGELAPANQDIFTDLSMLLRQQRSQPERTAPTGAEADRAIMNTPMSAWSPAKPTGADAARLAAAPARSGVEVASDRSVVIHTMAGSQADLFNQYMTRGQAHLKAGRFQDASGAFELAVSANIVNPLGHMALGLTSFAANEPYTAAVRFQQAIALFPAIMETRLDIGAMMDRDVFAARLADMDRRLAGEAKPEAALTFLGAYLHYMAGKKPMALKYAQQLKDSGTQDKTYLMFAGFVLKNAKASTAPATP